jgi:hypothetical protein
MAFVRYPDIAITVTDLEGRTIDIVERVARRLRNAGVPEHEIEAFTKEATKSDKDHCLRTIYYMVDYR